MAGSSAASKAVCAWGWGFSSFTCDKFWIPEVPRCAQEQLGPVWLSIQGLWLGSLLVSVRGSLWERAVKKALSEHTARKAGGYLLVANWNCRKMKRWLSGDSCRSHNRTLKAAASPRTTRCLLQLTGVFAWCKKCNQELWGHGGEPPE